MRALDNLNPDGGQVERALVDLHRACQAFIADVYSRAAQMDPREEMDWSDLALGFLLGRGCELPEEDNDDGSPAGYTVGVYHLLDQLACGGADAINAPYTLEESIIAVVRELFTSERVAEVIS